MDQSEYDGPKASVHLIQTAYFNQFHKNFKVWLPGVDK